MSYRLRGFGDSAIPAPVVGGAVPTSAGMPSAGITVAGIKSILFPTISGEAAGVQIIAAVAAWGAIGLTAWFMFGRGGGSPRRYGR